MSSHLIEPEVLMAYLDGELPPDRAAIAGEHLEHCRECQAIAADLQSVSRQLMAWQVEGYSPSVERVNAALEQGGPGRTVRSRWSCWTSFDLRRWMFGLAGAGACLSAAFMVWTLELQPRMQLRRHLKQEQQSALIAPPGRTSVDAIRTAEIELPRGEGGRMIIRTAQLSITTTEFDRVRGRIGDILKRRQGYIGELSISSPVGAPRTLEATLRVPAAQLEGALGDLKTLGRVESESQGGEEVTAQYVDLEARLSNARNAEHRLTSLLKRAGKLADVLAVEREIEQVRGSIERMEAEKKNLTSRIDFAALTLKFVEIYKAQMQMVPGSLAARLQNAAVDGYRTMVEGMVAVVLLALSYGPSALIWGAALFFPVRAMWKRLRRPAL